MKLKALNNGESGRSMVEMLGVLAIIGVLTVGGIFGYIYGMNKYRANEILDGANKRAYAVATMLNAGHVQRAEDVDLSEFKDSDEAPGGTFDGRAEDFVEQFGIVVRGVEKPVCENMIRMMGRTTTLRAITKWGTGEEYKTDLKSGDCSEGENDLRLMYNSDMSGYDVVAGSGGSSTGGSTGSSTGGGSGSSSVEPDLSPAMYESCPQPGKSYCDGENKWDCVDMGGMGINWWLNGFCTEKGWIN